MLLRHLLIDRQLILTKDTDTYKRNSRDNLQTTDLHPKAAYTLQLRKPYNGAFIVLDVEVRRRATTNFAALNQLCNTARWLLSATKFAALDQLLNIRRVGFFRRRRERTGFI